MSDSLQPALEFSGLDYQSELSFTPPGDLPDLGIEPMFLLFLYWHVDYLLLNQGEAQNRTQWSKEKAVYLNLNFK